MSKEVDALVIIGESYAIAAEAPHFAYEDFDQGLWYVRHGKTTWYDGKPITKEDKTSLLAGEVFLRLGRVASDCFSEKSNPNLPFANPFWQSAVDTFDKISPFGAGETLPEAMTITRASLKSSERGLPEMFDTVLASKPNVHDELKEKWHHALEIHSRRGTVSTMGYDVEAIFRALKGLNIEEISPDRVEFDENLHLVDQVYNLAELVNRTGLKPSHIEVPYYQTFSLVKKNAPEMLANALEDLRELRRVIKTT